MVASIGLRFYHITLRHEDGRQGDANDLSLFRSCVVDFINKNGSFSSSEELQRAFSFSSDNLSISNSDISGYIRYGTFGYESDIVDTETLEIVHKRTIKQMEQIPLFFKFWFPVGCNYAVAAFQSFSGRSCKQLVVGRLYEFFKAQNRNFQLSFRKIMPQEMQGTGFFSSPVKEVTLIKKDVPRDRASAYVAMESSSEFKLRVSIVAKRNGTLGRLSDVFNRATSVDSTFLVFNDIKFDEARASVSIGGRRRIVGLVGHNADAGVIEISDDVSMAGDGHPEHASLESIIDSILVDIQSFLGGLRQ